MGSPLIKSATTTEFMWTCSKGLTGVGLHKRSAWYAIKERKASDGTYTHTIDPKYSELYGGEEREFFPPFEARGREKDYGEVWAALTKKMENA